MRRVIATVAGCALVFAAAADAKPRVIIRWAKTGGFAGVQETLRIRSDNVALAGARGSANPYPAQLSARQVARLRRLLDDAHLETLKRRYPAPGAADTFQYSVTYRGHTVEADQTKVPKRLRPALAALQKTYDDIFASSERYVDPQHAALAAARKRWREHGLRSYRFRLRVVCFCPAAGTYRTIRVRNGKPSGASSSAEAIDTVPEMFRQIARALADPAAGKVSARYDAKLGYPRAASIDRLKRAMDDEISWSADRLRRLP